MCAIREINNYELWRGSRKAVTFVEVDNTSDIYMVNDQDRFTGFFKRPTWSTKDGEGIIFYGITFGTAEEMVQFYNNNNWSDDLME